MIYNFRHAPPFYSALDLTALRQLQLYYTDQLI
jgi:hypothetical protein